MGAVPSAERTTRALALVPILAALVVGGIVAAHGTEVGASGVAAASGRQIWLADCATCHGAHAEGTNRGPSLAGVGVFKRKWGEPVDVRPAWDLPLRPALYRGLRLALAAKRQVARAVRLIRR